MAVGLSLAAALAFPSSAIDYGDKNGQSFDYTPESGQSAPVIAQPMVTSEYEDAEIIDDPFYGVVVVSKQRAKNWALRAVYLLLADLALIFLIFSLPKTDEYNVMASYALSGASFVMAFWEFLCAFFLFRLGSPFWLYIFPVSVIMAVIFYVTLMNIKKHDVPPPGLEETARQMCADAKNGRRLDSVDPTPGTWPDQDFIS